MDTNTEQLVEEQWGKLPRTLQSFVSNKKWEDSLSLIFEKFKTESPERALIKMEVLLVLTGLVHPDAFREVLGEEAHTVDPEVLDAITAEINTQIFTLAYKDLLQFFEDGVTTARARGESDEEGSPTTETPAPGTAPANIPTEVTEIPLIPPLIPKTITPAPEVAVLHPFEEKMRMVFATAPARTAPPMPATFTPETPRPPEPTVTPPPVPAPASQIPTSTTPPTIAIPNTTGAPHDSYREPID